MATLGTYAPAAPMITGPQVKFLTSLTNELFDLTARITGADVTADRAAAIDALSTLDRRAASKRIDDLKSATLPTMRQTAAYVRQTVEAPVAAPPRVELDTDGIYVVAGAYYRVKRSGQGRLYALCLNTSSREWIYAPGMVGRIAPGDRITAEHAARLPFSWCIRCARELSREDSIARRMGPVCYRKSVG